MIIKSLSRKSNTTGQLFNYLFRYMLNEEKQELLPHPLRAIAAEANKHGSEREFEESLIEQDILQYHEIPVDGVGNTNMPYSHFGDLGEGFYFSSNAVKDIDQVDETYIAKKYVIDNKKPFFDAGRDKSDYYKLWGEILRQCTSYTSPADIHDKVREHLKGQGYAGIKTDGRTIVFDPKVLTEMPDNFYKYAREYFPKMKTESRHPQFVLRHNIHSRSVPGYIKEFEKNEANRMHQRKNNVHAYHTILSFSNKDTEHVNEKVLTDMAKKYIDLRGKDNLYVMTAHYDKDHIHLHCAMSGTKLNGLSARVSRQEFANIKVALDIYQKEKYPQLVHSLPRHGKTMEKDGNEDFKNIKRNERAVDRNALLKVLDEIYSKATSQEQFLDELKQLGHIPYSRSGKLTGIKFNGDRKFRFNRLGYDEKKFFELSMKAKEEKTLQEMQEIRNTSQGKFIQQTVTLEDRLKGLDNQEQRKVLQESVNRNRAFEEKNNITNPPTQSIKEDTRLQELRDIRENIHKETDRNHTHEDIDRDRMDDRNNHAENDEMKNEPNDDDKNAEPDPAHDDSNDEPTL